MNSSRRCSIKSGHITRHTHREHSWRTCTGRVSKMQKRGVSLLVWAACKWGGGRGGGGGGGWGQIYSTDHTRRIRASMKCKQHLSSRWRAQKHTRLQFTFSVFLRPAEKHRIKTKNKQRCFSLCATKEKLTGKLASCLIYEEGKSVPNHFISTHVATQR